MGVGEERVNLNDKDPLDPLGVLDDEGCEADARPLSRHPKIE